MPIPMDLIVFNELRIIGSLGCPVSSNAGMLSMGEAGRLQPTRLVEAIASVADAGKLLNEMTDYNNLGFSLYQQQG